MYKVEYNDDGRLLMLKIEELCLFSPKAIDGVIARLKALRERPWHDWSADRHNRKALEMVIQNGGLPGLFAAGALEIEQTQQQPAAPVRKPHRRQPARPARRPQRKSARSAGGSQRQPAAPARRPARQAAAPARRPQRHRRGGLAVVAGGRAS
jgi:hypothetical protein